MIKKAKISTDTEALYALVVAFHLVDRALTHFEDAPWQELYSNELYWLRECRRQLSYGLAHVEGYSPALLERIVKAGFQTSFDAEEASSESGAEVP